MADVRFEGATRLYPGTSAPAVDALDLHAEDGEFMVLVGPSGSGKTTALRMLAGLEEIDEGSIFIGERDVTFVAAKNRDVAMVFQNYALYPYLSVAANIGFPLRIAKVKKAERDRRVQEVASMLGLTEYLERKPAPSSRAASGSGWRWGERSSAIRASTSWTSPSRTSTPSCGFRCGPTSPLSRRNWA
jgi:multiple sugar transport system ATP-binding protein